jgi:hypothetical protein
MAHKGYNLYEWVSGRDRNGNIKFSAGVPAVDKVPQ